tara:strand:+ start:9 stop:953 length:945 start_codon:yes stop_codon:yes gene_type:complete
MAASRVNQYRFHRGYHYPRSTATVNQLKQTSSLFSEQFSDCVSKSYRHLYAIANQDSLVSKDQYLSFLEDCELKYKIIKDVPGIKKDNISLIIEVDEGLIDYQNLRITIQKRISNQKKLSVRLNTKFTSKLIDDYDYIVTCGYGMCTNLLPEDLQYIYKYQLIEKIVIKPPEILKNLSIVVVDGPFMCIDPLPNSDLSILGNVKHAIHSTSWGKKPSPLPRSSNIVPWRDIKDEKKSRFKTFINHGNNYLTDFKNSKFLYSMIGYRVILPNVEASDDRTTIVRHKGKFIDVFSGKIDTCSWAAKNVLRIISSNK